MEPLIITATPNVSWLQPDVYYPKTVDEIIAEAKKCEQAGASIYHIHGEQDWVRIIRGIREESNIIIQCGMSSLELKERQVVFSEKTDMISIITSHHDEAFVGKDFYVLHPRDELIEYGKLSEKSNVRLEYEIWNTGSIWNLNFLIEKKFVTPPYWCTLFFGWPGGQWSPPTVEEYLYRRQFIPQGAVVNVSSMAKENQIALLTNSILHGDHVRVGTEDNPFGRDGQLTTTHQLVAEIAELSRFLGRPVATCDQAKKIIGIKNS